MSARVWAVTPEPYRELLRIMIAADGPCQSPTCGVTILGHLLAEAPPHLVDLVLAEALGQQPTPGSTP